MNTSMKYLIVASATALLVACGGGGTTSPSTSVATPSTPVATAIATPALSATPTAVLVNNQTEANALAAEVKAGLTGAQGANGASALPMGVQAAALPTGVTMDLTPKCQGGGSASLSGDITQGSTSMPVNTPLTTTFNNCALFIGGATASGSMVITFTRYTSAADAAFNINFSNFSMSGGGLPSMQTFSGAVACEYQGAVTASSCYYSDGNRSWDTGTSYTSGTAHGSYATNYGSGTVKVALSGFGTPGGTATITGANGYSAVVTYNSAISYTVVITVNGTPTTYTVTV
jgi:hypothetical protein